MPDIETIRTWEGRTMLDRDSGRIGTIDAIYLDDQTGQPEWALVNTGLFGTKASFVPSPRPSRATTTSSSPTTSSWSRTPPGSTPTGTSRRPRNGSCGGTMASTTTLLTGPSRPTGTRSGPPRWDGTPRGQRPMTP